MSEELKPCPFCGSTEIEVAGFTRDGPFFIECGGCALYTPNTDTRREALDAWNTRAETPQSIPSEREALEAAIFSLGHINATCFGGDLKRPGDLARATLLKISILLGDERYDELALASQHLTRQALEQGSAK